MRSSSSDGPDNNQEIGDSDVDENGDHGDEDAEYPGSKTKTKSKRKQANIAKHEKWNRPRMDKFLAALDENEEGAMDIEKVKLLDVVIRPILPKFNTRPRTLRSMDMQSPKTYTIHQNMARCDCASRSHVFRLSSR